MSKNEKQEHVAIEQMSRRKSSTAYLSAKRAKVPVTVVRGDTIYQEVEGNSIVIGKVSPSVKLTQKVVVLK